jgi:hypothetical protein
MIVKSIIFHYISHMLIKVSFIIIQITNSSTKIKFSLNIKLHNKNYFYSIMDIIKLSEVIVLFSSPNEVERKNAETFFLQVK